ncbi:hypothetical protein CRM22_007746 [Opisthorchis felineus]|uniref:Uncharacterized protein n=1 Tax=Opisthorchis felineus TaxID=147828 RepID=A0A4V3SDT2_OPIFE|nr:hypothetical protein CRM22_007746 [Opisthorchis felineus]
MTQSPILRVCLGDYLPFFTQSIHSPSLLRVHTSVDISSKFELFLCFSLYKRAELLTMLPKPNVAFFYRLNEHMPTFPFSLRIIVVTAYFSRKNIPDTSSLYSLAHYFQMTCTASTAC